MIGGLRLGIVKSIVGTFRLAVGLLLTCGLAVSLMLTSSNAGSQEKTKDGKLKDYSMGSTVRDDWKKINLVDFQFYLPGDMKDQKVRGIDSAVWDYRNDCLRLAIDYGMYSNDLKSLASQPNHDSEWVLINCQKAYVVTCRYEKSYISAVHFPALWDSDTKLTFYVEGKSDNTQKIAREIFQSIKFRK